MYRSRVQPGSRSQILQWINRTLNINETRIENLGTGVVYCMLINHFHPGSIPQSRIIAIPRSPHDYRTNLRRLQEVLFVLEIKSITIDVFKVAEMTYPENWSLICKFYKLFSNKTSKQKEKSILSESQWQPKTIENKPTQPYIKPTNLALSTPMKGPKMEEGNRWQTMTLIEEIRRIVSGQGVSDRNKVSKLRRLLGLQEEEGAQSETDLKDLLSDYKKKQEVIQID